MAIGLGAILGISAATILGQILSDMFIGRPMEQLKMETQTGLAKQQMRQAATLQQRREGAEKGALRMTQETTRRALKATRQEQARQATAAILSQLALGSLGAASAPMPPEVSMFAEPLADMRSRGIVA